LRNNLADIKSERDRLTERFNTLKNLQPDVNSETSKDIANVLPSSNPALLVLFQLRQEASNNGLTFNNLNMSLVQSDSSDPSGVGKVNLSFYLDGDYNNISTFLSNISKMAPFLNLNNLEISEKSGSMEAFVEIESYWSSFPKTLPSVKESIVGLTDEDKSLLSEIASFKQIVTPTSKLSPQEEELRQNPFEALNPL
jgi:Tfp pilus assembly protein PilO